MNRLFSFYDYNNDINNNNNNDNNNFHITKVNHPKSISVKSVHNYYNNGNNTNINRDSCSPVCITNSNSTAVAITSATAAMLIIIGVVSTYSIYWFH